MMNGAVPRGKVAGVRRESAANGATAGATVSDGNATVVGKMGVDLGVGR